MARGGAEVVAGTFEGVGVAIAFGTSERERAGRQKFAESGAFAVEGDVASFGLGDLQEITADAGETDGLRGRSAFVRGGHFFDVEVVDAEEQRGSDEKGCKSTHELIVLPRNEKDKRGERSFAKGNNRHLRGRECDGIW